MAEVGLAVLSASLSVLFDRVISQEVLNFLKGSKLTVTRFRKLKTAVLSVNAVLADAEEKQLTNPSVKHWVDELKDVLFDAEDILDEIATEALQRKLDAESSTPAEKNGKVLSINILMILSSNPSPTDMHLDGDQVLGN